MTKAMYSVGGQLYATLAEAEIASSARAGIPIVTKYVLIEPEHDKPTAETIAKRMKKILSRAVEERKGE